MESMTLLQEVAHQHLFNQFWLSLFFIIPMILVARAVVAGTRYSAILIIVIFGLLMGFVLVAAGVSSPGLADLPMLGLMAQSTIIALAASFFVGGQELRRVFAKTETAQEESVIYAMEQVFFGTGRTQVIFITRAFFLLLGLEALTRLILGTVPDTALGRYYPVMAYMGLIIAVILIDHKATITDKRRYLHKGVTEMAVLLAVLVAGNLISFAIRPLIALPTIFFVMLVACGLGVLLHRWGHGPVVRCLLFAGIPVVLAANFIIGGSRIADAFVLEGMSAVLAYGFFGQILWMFGGIAVLIFFGRSRRVRNIGPGMAGALSHAGLTGACTAGDFGDIAAIQGGMAGAPAAEMIAFVFAMPFLVHPLVFFLFGRAMEKDGQMPAAPVYALTGTGLAGVVPALILL